MTTSTQLDFRVIQQSYAGFEPAKPKLKAKQFFKIIYAIALLMARSMCNDLGWERAARVVSVHKFHLFPELRRWQVDKWVRQFKRQRLFPKASESEFEHLAKELVMGFMI